jgi:hypothetical protein
LASPRLPDRRIVVTALGITQIFAWGSTFYLLGVLATPIGVDTGWSLDWVMAGVSTHLLPLLQARGIDLAIAVSLGTLVGPSQVGARLIEMLAGRHYHPIWTMIASTVLVAIGTSWLFISTSAVAVAIIFYGTGNGIGSVARGTLPLALFGPERYATLMGRLAFPILLSMALSPYLAALAFKAGGATFTLALLFGLGAINVILAFVLRHFIQVRTPMI